MNKYNYFKILAHLTTLEELIPYVIKLHKDTLPQFLSLNVQIESDSEDKHFFTVGSRYPVNINDPISV